MTLQLTVFELYQSLLDQSPQGVTYAQAFHAIDKALSSADKAALYKPGLTAMIEKASNGSCREKIVLRHEQESFAFPAAMHIDDGDRTIRTRFATVAHVVEYEKRIDEKKAHADEVYSERKRGVAKIIGVMFKERANHVDDAFDVADEITDPTEDLLA